ncbi:hypothetical protein ACFL6C_00895 [Myxococcota bacterium]
MSSACCCTVSWGGALQDDEALQKKVQRLRGDVWLRAGNMWVTLCFDGEGIEVVRGRTERRRASVEGEMDALLGVVTGAGMFGPLLRRRMKVGGNLFFLLKMLPILVPKG